MTKVGLSLHLNAKYKAAMEIAVALREAGFAAYFAGGCVRDMLLGVEPKDFDVATSATPDQVMALFAGHGQKTLAVGAQFGVVLVLRARDEQEQPQASAAGTSAEDAGNSNVDGSGENGAQYTEVATFRHDGVYTDGRRPDAVRFSTEAAEDVVRRDFTINGMLLDPVLYEVTGLLDEAVLDYVGGREDLAAGIVRAIGDARRRFTEDKLRMPRGVRFAARLGFRIEAETLAAIQELAPKVGKVSAERMREELTKMLTEGHARRAFELLDVSGLLTEILPEAVRMHGVEQPREWHPEGDVWMHTMLLLEKLRPGCAATLAWGALLHDIGKPATYRVDRPDEKTPGRIRFNGHVEVGVRIAEEILRRLRFSNDDAAQVLALVQNHMRFGDVMEMKESTLRRFLRLPEFDEHLELHWLDCMSCHGKLALYDFARERYLREPEVAERPALLVTGKDLIGAGYRPGIAFKAMLEAAEDAQLEGRIRTTAEGLRLLERSF